MNTPTLDILIPTCHRKTGLAITLTSLLGQTFRQFNVFIADQTEDEDYIASVEIQSIVRAFALRGVTVTASRHLPRRGMAEQRHFLLRQSSATYVQYLDDDLLLEPDVVERMVTVLAQERCGFVGCPVSGLSYLGDVRPWQHNIEVWEGPVQPEPLSWETIPWDRHKVNNAANPIHLYQKLAGDGRTIRYKVAWVGGNVMYDRAKLLAVGGFSWWYRLPPEHAGEEVLAQFLLLHRFGGCGILPNGTYHLELPTEVPDRRTNASHLFPQVLAELTASERKDEWRNG